MKEAKEKDSDNEDEDEDDEDMEDAVASESEEEEQEEEEEEGKGKSRRQRSAYPLASCLLPCHLVLLSSRVLAFSSLVRLFALPLFLSSSLLLPLLYSFVLASYLRSLHSRGGMARQAKNPFELEQLRQKRVCLCVCVCVNVHVSGSFWSLRLLADPRKPL
jgi:hypothetical protein